MLRIPHCLDNRLRYGGEAVSFTRRPAAFCPQEDSLHSLLLEAESTPSCVASLGQFNNIITSSGTEPPTLPCLNLLRYLCPPYCFWYSFENMESIWIGRGSSFSHRHYVQISLDPPTQSLIQRKRNIFTEREAPASIARAK
jgi:hypothetical protein